MTLLCPDCFGDSGLKYRLKEIRPEVGRNKCDYHKTKKGIPIEHIVELIDPIFRQHYGIGEFEHWRDEQAGDPLEYCVGDFTEAEEDAATVLTEALLETEHAFDPDHFYAGDQYYVPIETGMGNYVHSDLWKRFCESITYDVRFFNEEAEQNLKEIFDGIQHQKDRDLNPPVRRLQPNDQKSVFWRARIANNQNDREDIKKRPALELGAPPMRLRRAGRMNASGIRAFYAAFDTETTLSEIRPVVGDVVMVGKFELLRDVYVLDTTRFSAPIKDASVFSRSYEQRVNQWAFMQEFMEEIAKPISPHDTHLDYIPTQAVAEYLVHRHRFKRHGKDVSIEGIIFNSAQNSGGKNIVLFGDAATSQLTEEEETIRKERNSTVQYESWFDDWSQLTKKSGSPALKVAQNSVIAKEISGARYESTPHTDYDPDLGF